MVLFLTISLIPLSILSYIQFTTAEKEISDQIFSRLSTASLLVESQVNSEIEKHFLLVDLFTSRVLLRTSLEEYNQDGNEQSKENIQNIINQAFVSNPQIDSILIFNDKELVAFVGEHDFEEENIDFKSLIENQEFKKIDFVLKDAFEGHYLHLRLVGNLQNENNKQIGIVVLDFNPGKIFLGTQELGLGNTGEYVIGKKSQDGDSIIITSIGSANNSEFNTISKDRLDIPMTQALLKNEGIYVNLVDYDEKPVFAITDYLDSYDLGLVVKIDKNDALSSIEQFRFFTFVFSMSTIILAIISAIVYSKSISRPITKIRAATKQIVSGKFSEKLSVKGSDELQQLSEDINNMAHELEIQKSHLINSERFSAIGELSARIAHDLKNPLNNLSMAIETFHLRHKDQFDEKDLEKFKIMKKSISRMNRQINGVLNFVRKSPISLSKHSLRQLLESALSVIEKPSNVKIQIPQNDCVINCDAKLESVFMNLFNNSLDSIGDEGEIKVEMIEKDDEVILNFIDSGKEIDKDVLPHIFDPLFTTKEHGTGLGLATCKNIVEQHGGTIIVKNNPTTFTIRLPK